MSRRRIVLVFTLLALASLAATIGLPGSGPAGPARSLGEAAQSQPSGASLSVKGRLVPGRWVRLSFPVAGQVAEILVEEGQEVEEGALLARLGDQRKYEANIASAERELLAARQAYDELQRNAGLELALAGQRLAQAQKIQAFAHDRVKSLKKPTPTARIEQAHANMLLAQQALENARRDLDKAEKLWNDRKDFIWRFISRHDFKLQLILLRSQVARAEGRYNDAVDKYQDLKKPVDEIDLLQAEADLAVASAQVEQAARERDARLGGPDPDQVALTQARIRSAGAALRAAQAQARDAQIRAPFAGQVVSIAAKAQQWMRAGELVLYLADESGWEIELNELKEKQVSQVQPGMAVQASFEALPGLELRGSVESIGLLYGEKDGDVVYTAKIALLKSDPRLRWGMTARARLGNP